MHYIQQLRNFPCGIMCVVRNSKAVVQRTFVNLSYKVISKGRLGDPEIPTVFLLHDLLGSKKLWDGVGKILATVTKQTVLALDLRNHGDSTHHASHKYPELAEDILEVMDKLAINRVLLLGHSMGGRASMCLSMMAAKRVAGLIVVDISPVSSCKALTEDMLNTMHLMKSVNFEGQKNLSKSLRLAKTHLRPLIQDDFMLRMILNNISTVKGGAYDWRCNLDALIKNFNHIVSFPEEFTTMKYDGPTLFIGGQRSDYIPPDDLPLIRNLFPQAVVTYITGAGHNVHSDDPRSFMELIIQFIKKNNERQLV